MCRADGESPEFYLSGYHTARKPQQCVECRRQIQPGERYKRHFGKYEGDVFGGKTCEHCQVAQDWLVQVCSSFTHELVLDDIEEHALEYPECAFGLLRVVVGMRRNWQRFDKAGLMDLPPLPPMPAFMIEEVEREFARLVPENAS